MLRLPVVGLIVLLAAGAGSACKPALAASPCGTLDTRLRPASSNEGHRVGIIFTDLGNQHVTLTANEVSILNRTLTSSPEDSTGFAGLIQCQFDGQTQFIFSVDGRTSSLTLNIEEPTKIYFTQGRDGPSFAVYEEPDDALLLD